MLQRNEVICCTFQDTFHERETNPSAEEDDVIGQQLPFQLRIMHFLSTQQPKQKNILWRFRLPVWAWPTLPNRSPVLHLQEDRRWAKRLRMELPRGMTTNRSMLQYLDYKLWLSRMVLLLQCHFVCIKTT